MRKVQLVAAAVAMLVMSSTAAVAQGGGGGGGGGGGRGRGGAQMMTMLMQGITLSAEQQAKVDSITKKYADMQSAMMQDETMDQQARRAKMQENRTKQMDEVKAVLTDDQKKMFEKNMENMPQGRGRPPAE